MQLERSQKTNIAVLMSIANLQVSFKSKELKVGESYIY